MKNWIRTRLCHPEESFRFTIKDRFFTVFSIVYCIVKKEKRIE